MPGRRGRPARYEDNAVSQVIKRIREENGITNVEFTEALGVHKNTPLRWKTHPDSVTAYYLHRMDELYGLTDEEIISIVREARD